MGNKKIAYLHFPESTQERKNQIAGPGVFYTAGREQIFLICERFTKTKTGC